MHGLLKNKITEIVRLNYNLDYCNLELIINDIITISFEYYYNIDTPNIIYNELLQDKIFLDPDELNFFLRPFNKYNSRIISIKNINQV